MNTQTAWQWDEEGVINFDFGDRAVVAAYDERHSRFRDIDGEVAAALSGMEARPDQVVMDFACGTGSFALRAARVCRRVLAVDLSAAMLDYVGWRAQEQGLENIECRRGGFLGYAHEGPPVDALHTSLALHHLPDFWKAKALARLAAMIKPGGRFHLMDVVFQEDNPDVHIAEWIGQMEAKGGPEVADSIRKHVGREYSTYTWIMEGLLERAGFRIDRAETSGGVLANYYCTKAG